MNMRPLAAALCAALVFLVAVGGVRAERSAMDQVKETIEDVLATLRLHDLAPAERRNRITKTIRARFDFAAMGQRALARDWSKADPDQREQFVRLFSDLLEYTYVGRIEAYSDERVEYRREREKEDKSVVETVIVTKSVEIPMEYRLLRRDGDWLVYDVVIEGVSLVRNFRTTYGEIVRKEGFEGLFQRMEAKIAELRSGEGKG